MLTAAFFDTALETLPRRSATPPLVSIILATGGSSDPVPAIDSILSERDLPLELIIVDEASGDAAAAAIDECRQEDDRVAVLRFRRPTGIPAHLLNTGLKHAGGRFVGYQLPDSRLLPGGLEALIRHAEVAGALLVHGGVNDAEAATKAKNTAEIGPSQLAIRNPLAAAGLIHRRDILDRVGLFDPHLAMRGAHEWDLWQRIAAEGDFDRIAQMVAILPADNQRGKPADDFGRRIAIARMRSDRRGILAEDAIGDCDILSDKFLGENFNRNAFHARCILPYLGRCFSRTELRQTELASALLPTERMIISTAGSVRSATVEMAYRNFARTFPDAIGVVEEDVPAIHDVAVNLRSLTPPWAERRRRAIEERKPVVYALDDDLFALYGRRAENRPVLEAVEDHVRDSDYIVVYSPALIERVAAFNPRVTALAMNTPRSHLGRSIDPNGTRQVTRYLLIGRVIRGRELRLLSEELRDFFAAHPTDATLTIFSDERLDPEYREILAGIDYETTPLKHYLQFRRFLADSDYDFVLNPLRETRFNRGKSPVKYLEATMAGAVLISSRASVYKLVRNEETGITVPWTPGAWHDALEASLAMSESERATIHAAAVAHIIETRSTEACYLPFRTTLEAAQLHATFQSRLRQDGMPRILVDDPSKTGLADHIRTLLAPLHFTILDAGDVDLPKAGTTTAKALEAAEISLVHAASPRSDWFAAASEIGVPTVCAVDGPDDLMPAYARPIRDEPDIVIAPDEHAASAADLAGYPRVTRWTRPTQHSKRFADGSPHRVRGGLRIVSRAGSDASIDADLAANTALAFSLGKPLRVEIDCVEDQRELWRATFSSVAPGIEPRFVDRGQPRRRAVLLTLGSDQRTHQAILGAMASGVPVITACDRDAPSIADGVAIHVSDPSASAIAEALTRIYALPPHRLAERRKRASAAAFALASPEIAAANLIRIYREAASAAERRFARHRMSRSINRPHRTIDVEVRDGRARFLGVRSSDPLPPELLEVGYPQSWRGVAAGGDLHLVAASGGVARIVVAADNLSIGFLQVGGAPARIVIVSDGSRMEVAVNGECWRPLAKEPNGSSDAR